MMKNKFDLIIPIYNEGHNLVDLFNHLKKSIKSQYRILLCYDENNDDVFDYLKVLKKINSNDNIHTIGNRIIFEAANYFPKIIRNLRKHKKKKTFYNSKVRKYYKNKDFYKKVLPRERILLL